MIYGAVDIKTGIGNINIIKHNNKDIILEDIHKEKNNIKNILEHNKTTPFFQSIKFCLRKGSYIAESGNVIIITKPLGIGVLFAADMRGKAKAKWIEEAIRWLQVSNAKAAFCFKLFESTSCTDITGFGLFGHISEMLIACKKAKNLEISENNSKSSSEIKNNLCANIYLNKLPILTGALECSEMKITSTLSASNKSFINKFLNKNNYNEIIHHKKYPFLFDPQTSGGLIAFVPSKNVNICISELKRCGYTSATAIGYLSNN